jgi:hypothetical protein
MNTQTIETFLKEIGTLDDEKFLSVTDSLSSLLLRAQQLTEKKAAAEKKLKEIYPTCSCGKPVKYVGYLTVEYTTCKPAIFPATVGVKGEKEIVAGLENDGDWDSLNIEGDRFPGLTNTEKASHIGFCGEDDCKGYTLLNVVSASYRPSESNPIPEDALRINYR